HCADGIALLTKFLDAISHVNRSVCVHLEETVQRRPAHGFRHRVVARHVADFPNPAVGLTPLFAYGSAETLQHAGCDASEGHARGSDRVGSDHRLAIDVELALKDGVI